MYLSGWAIFFILACIAAICDRAIKQAREEGRQRGLWEAEHRYDFNDSDY